MNQLFSVIIPALNEEKLLPRLLKSLKEQHFTDFEVILVDANSKDGTIFEAKKFEKALALTIAHTSEKNVSLSRNLGAKKAKGKYLFFIDSDNYVHPAFLQKAKEILEKGNDMIVPAVSPDSDKFTHKISFMMVNRLVPFFKIIGIYFSTGGNVVVRRDVYQKLKGFDEKIIICEDHDLVQRAAKNGFKVAFAQNPKVVFSVRRLEKEGIVLLLKYFISTVYIVFFGKITKKIYNYQMGGDYYKKPS